MNQPARVGNQLLSLKTPLVMGILNYTPDSFFSGSRIENETEGLRKAENMLHEGAAFLDVGGYSTRPNAPEISEEEECQRVLPFLTSVRKNFPDALLSIDTFRATIARQALEAGANVINDVSGGSEEMFSLLAQQPVPYICMHTRGTPQTMMRQTQYDNLVQELLYFFSERIETLQQKKVPDIWLDPGFGFAKTVEQNFHLLQHLDDFKLLNKPIVVGLSRKSMIWKTLHTTPDKALNGTTALHTIALLKGASILRTHDVKEAVEVVKLVQAMRGTF